MSWAIEQHSFCPRATGRFQNSILQASIWSSAILTRLREVWKHLLDRIRAQRLDTQLILTSRTAAEREWLEALQVGAFDLLAKPYLKSEVLRVTSNALAMNYNRRFTAT